MATRFYLHDAASGDTGTLPGASSINDEGLSPEVTATNAATNRDMSTTIGAGQTSVAITTQANTNVQDAWFRRFLSAPLATQTIASQTVTASLAASESNANSQFNVTLLVYGWRPSTGAVVGHVCTLASGNSHITTTPEAGTSETSVTGTTSVNSDSLAVTDGDILVCEIWRAAQAQLMGTAYTNTFFYDGTTEGSTSNNGGYIDFANTLTFSSGAAATSLLIPHRNRSRIIR